MNNTMPLSYLNTGKFGQIECVNGSEKIYKKLMEMGFNKGAVIKIVQDSFGPIIVKVDATTVAISRGMAHNIMVKEI